MAGVRRAVRPAVGKRPKPEALDPTRLRSLLDKGRQLRLKVEEGFKPLLSVSDREIHFRLR